MPRDVFAGLNTKSAGELAKKVEEASVDGSLPPVSRKNAPMKGMMALSEGVAADRRELSEKAAQLAELQARLADQEGIIEIDPNLVDPAPVGDRLPDGVAGDPELVDLMKAIEENGQQVPILVRPHPKIAGRFQAAYGWRRATATRELGIKVRAVVRNLSDADLVVAQGQENNARKNLSFIERALWATRLQAAGVDNHAIMAGLRIDKTLLSRFLAITGAIPMDIIETIGRAPTKGRTRWETLAKFFSERGERPARKVMAAPDFMQQTSDQRFTLIHDAMSTRARSEKVRRSLTSTDGTVLAQLSSQGSAHIVEFDNESVPGFGDFVLSRLAALFHDFKSAKTE